MSDSDGWKSYAEDDPAEWYSKEQAEFSGEWKLDSDELEAARRFVSRWLLEDAHGFVIPGSEWGRTLKHWLGVMLAHTGPYQTFEESQAAYQLELLKNQGKLWRVDLLMEQERELSEDDRRYPWLRFYTNNAEWILNRSRGYVTPSGEPFMRYSVQEITPQELHDDTLREEFEKTELYQDERTRGETRFVDSAVTVSLTARELDNMIRTRVLERDVL